MHQTLAQYNSTEQFRVRAQQANTVKQSNVNRFDNQKIEHVLSVYYQIFGQDVPLLLASNLYQRRYLLQGIHLIHIHLHRSHLLIIL